MELGMIGWGRWARIMAERLVRGGHRVVGFRSGCGGGSARRGKEAAGADSLEKLLVQLKAPRVVWLMVPAGAPVDQTIDLLTPHLSAGDTIIDGGNSYYKDSVRRAAALAPKKINFVDCGTSGGVWGLTEGYSMMVGGDADVVKRLSPYFPDSCSRSRKRLGTRRSRRVRPLREDGSQWHRVRNHAGLCRGSRFAPSQDRNFGSTCCRFRKSGNSGA